MTDHEGHAAVYGQYQCSPVGNDGVAAALCSGPPMALVVCALRGGADGRVAVARVWWRGSRAAGGTLIRWRAAAVGAAARPCGPPCRARHTRGVATGPGA